MSSPSAFQTSFHRHNGSDSPKVLMGDLQLDNRGLIFPTTDTSTILYTTPETTTASQALVIAPQGTNICDIYIGGGNSGAIFKDMYFQGVTQTLRADDLTDYTEVLNDAAFMKIDSTIALSGSTGWFLRLPNNATLPPSPQLGDICYYNNHLQVCQSAGTWTQI